MKPVYDSISPARGVHQEAIVQLQIVPREWLTADPVIDFETNMVIQPVQLEAGRYFLQLGLLEESIRYEENPKTSASGNFYTIEVSGLLNYSDAELNNVLQTLQQHELVVLVKDQKKQYRLVGNTTHAMRFLAGAQATPENGGTLRRPVSLAMDTELLPPYYLFSSSSSS